MENQFFVYRHIRLDKNVPFYVGIGKKLKKYNGHRTEYKRAYTTYKRNVYWKNVTNKTDYKVEILFESNNLDEIKNKEIEFISLYGRKEDGGTLVNLTSGGEFTSQEVYKYRKNFKHTKDTKEKIKNLKRDLAPEVYDRVTGQKFRCFKEACEQLGLNFKIEYDRVRYCSGKARIFKIKPTRPKQK